MRGIRSCNTERRAELDNKKRRGSVCAGDVEANVAVDQRVAEWCRKKALAHFEWRLCAAGDDEDDKNDENERSCDTDDAYGADGARAERSGLSDGSLLLCENWRSRSMNCARFGKHFEHAALSAT